MTYALVHEPYAGLAIARMARQSLAHLCFSFSLPF